MISGYLKETDIIVIGSATANATAKVIIDMEVANRCGEWEMKHTPEDIYIFIAPEDATMPLIAEIREKSNLLMSKFSSPAILQLLMYSTMNIPQ